MEKEQIQQFLDKCMVTLNRYDKPIKEKWNSMFPNYPLTMSPILIFTSVLFVYLVVFPILKNTFSRMKKCVSGRKFVPEKDMIYLYQSAPIDQILPSLSPFCTKLEAYLRFVNLEYRSIPDPNFKIAPKGKVPFIRHNDAIIGDSSLIINWINDQIDFDPDSNLVKEERALAVATKRLLEEHLYFIIMYYRYFTKDGFKFINSAFTDIPRLIRGPILKNIRRKVKETLYLQGISRFTEEELVEISNEDIKCLSDLLGETKYIFGTQEPTSLDIYLFVFIAAIIQVPFEYPLKTIVKNKANLVNHCKRMGHQYFPEYNWDLE